MNLITKVYLDCEQVFIKKKNSYLLCFSVCCGEDVSSIDFIPVLKFQFWFCGELSCWHRVGQTDFCLQNYFKFKKVLETFLSDCAPC